MVGVAGWTTGSSSGCGAAPNRKTSICKITGAGWRPDAGWGVGLTVTIKSGLTRLWATPRLRKCISRPTHTGPNRPPGRPCSPGTNDAPTGADRARRYAMTARGSKALEVRPPAAVQLQTLQKSEREDEQCPGRLVLSFRKFFTANQYRVKLRRSGAAMLENSEVE